MVWWMVARTNGSIPVPFVVYLGKFNSRRHDGGSRMWVRAPIVYYESIGEILATAGHHSEDHKCDKRDGRAKKEKKIASKKFN